MLDIRMKSAVVHNPWGYLLLPTILIKKNKEQVRGKHRRGRIPTVCSTSALGGTGKDRNVRCSEPRFRALGLENGFSVGCHAGAGLILGGSSVHRKLSQPLYNWGDHATAPRQGHSKKFNAGGGACPAGDTQALQPGHSGWRPPQAALVGEAVRGHTGPQARRGSLRWGMDGALASMAALRAWAA